MKTPELKSGYWSVNYLKLLANGDAPLSETSLRQCAEYIEAAYKAIDLLESRLAQVERERDALFCEARGCYSCKHQECEPEDPPCNQCAKDGSGYEWRGVCAENTKEEGK